MVSSVASKASIPLLPVTWSVPSQPSRRRLAAALAVGANSKSDRRSISTRNCSSGHGEDGIEAAQSRLDMRQRNAAAMRRRAPRRARSTYPPGRRPGRARHGATGASSARLTSSTWSIGSRRPAQPSRVAGTPPSPWSARSSPGCWPVEWRRTGTPRCTSSITTGASLMASGRVPMTNSIRALSSCPPGFGGTSLPQRAPRDKRLRLI